MQNLTMYTDPEIIRYVDRTDPVVDDLCNRLEARFDEAVELEIAELRGTIQRLETRVKQLLAQGVAA
ncbi:hypothetical protein [Sedimenticola hydrogenitrophicus]|uniref:hypothetical protein n=1 Tax=Sedimenticola hydrogenitrophicus TaxID=2967975 RepID=UPI0023AEC835|nr:hypothetical protein [Sedimenticola hydrogenitrophicus]